MAEYNNQTTKTNKATVVRQVVFPKALFDLIDIRLEQLGLTAPEYVRHLVIEDIKPLYQNIPMVNEETEQSIGRALEDIKAGRVTKFKDIKSLKKHLDKLSR